MFDLALFMDELAIAGQTIPGISRTFAYPAERVEPPALIVAWPEEIEYDTTYRGVPIEDEPQAMNEFVIPVFIVLGQGGTSRARRNQIAKWLSHEVKNAIERYPYTGKPVVHVPEATTDVISLADEDYLATKYTVEVSTTN